MAPTGVSTVPRTSRRRMTREEGIVLFFGVGRGSWGWSLRSIATERLTHGKRRQIARESHGGGAFFLRVKADLPTSGRTCCAADPPPLLDPTSLYYMYMSSPQPPTHPLSRGKKKSKNSPPRPPPPPPPLLLLCRSLTRGSVQKKEEGEEREKVGGLVCVCVGG